MQCIQILRPWSIGGIMDMITRRGKAAGSEKVQTRVAGDGSK